MDIVQASETKVKETTVQLNEFQVRIEDHIDKMVTKMVRKGFLNA